MLDEYVNELCTEYFSMETALRSEMPAHGQAAAQAAAVKVAST